MACSVRYVISERRTPPPHYDGDVWFCQTAFSSSPARTVLTTRRVNRRQNRRLLKNDHLRGAGDRDGVGHDPLHHGSKVGRNHHLHGAAWIVVRDPGGGHCDHRRWYSREV